MPSDKDLLIYLQDDYIKYLSAEVSKLMPVAYIHGYTLQEEDFIKGHKLREQIKFFKDKIHDSTQEG